MDEHSKTLIPLRSRRLPPWIGIPARIFALTFIGTLLTFAVSLLFAILGTVTVSALRGLHPDMRIAYRSIALPVAAIAALILLALAIGNEIRRYRQSRALNAIERMG